MLIVASALAVIGLAALVAAVATSNELIAWVCIGASGLGVLLLVVDAVRDRANRRSDGLAALAAAPEETTQVIETTPVIEAVEVAETVDVEAPDAAAEDSFGGPAEEDHPDELVYDTPDHDTPGDDEAVFPEPAEEAAVHIVGEPETAYIVGEPETAYIVGEPETAYIVGEPETEYIVGEPETEYIVGEPETAYTVGEPETEYIVSEPDGVHIVGEEYSDASAPEVRYITGPEGSDTTVVYTYTESAETEYIDNADSPVRGESGDR